MAGIYLHIPFCKRRCIYCDFYSTTRLHERETYVEALCRELQLRRDYLPSADRRIHTLYIGGGTPSLLPPHLLERLMACIYRTYDVDAEAEITIEANPDDITEEWIRDIRHLPFNRISMGIQTFNDRLLALLHRRHTGRQAGEAVERCRKAGLKNLSIDLIYGLPGQTEQQWETDLRYALQLGVQHLSAYALIYEEGTPLWRMREGQRVQEADENLSLRMFGTLMDLAGKAGFEHYEISNFAIEGFRARHNSSYWQGIPYIGCGAAAHSFDGKRRQWNVADMTTYIKGVHAAAEGRTDIAPYYETEQLTADEQYNEYIITRLRTSDGLSLRSLEDRFGPEALADCLHQAAPHLKQGTLEQTGTGILRLTRQGIFVSDGIMSDFLRV